MDDRPISIAGYPQAILHMDADAFFTSVEQALVPSLRGKPLATGQERGIIACASYEAKAMGVKRGVPLFMAKKICPDLTILPNDYETYSLYSRRMFNIMRRYTPTVEEYSIDEAFADLTGLRGLHRASYEDIARRIQDDVRNELHITVSAGLSMSKGLAKLCSKFRKPAGFTGVQGRHIHILLQHTPLDKVWGFGPNTVNLLHKIGMRTAYDYVQRPERWASATLHKPGRELWNELRGNSVWKVDQAEKSTYATILKSKTFTPSSRDPEFIYAKLIRNMESAFMKARRYHLRARVIGVVLRHQDFGHDGLEAKLNRPTSAPLEAMPIVRKLFDRLFNARAEYRATMLVLGALEDDRSEQFELFEDRLRIERVRQATQAVDALNRKYGKHTVSSGSALFLGREQGDSRSEPPARRKLSWKGENKRQRLGIPRASFSV